MPDADMTTTDILARTLYGEDRGDGALGMAAVAHVVLNRVALGGWWGTTIVDVCLHPWQFSCWNMDDLNRSKLLNVTAEDSSFELATSIAHLAVSGALGADTTNGADSYYAIGSSRPLWATGLLPCATIGAQIFFRTRGIVPTQMPDQADALNQAELNKLGESS